MVHVERCFDTSAASAGAASVDALVATWARAVDVTIHWAPDALVAVQAQACAAADAYDVVAEGLLNAVKHAEPAPIHVDIDVVASGAGRRLRIRVLSSGAPAGGGAIELGRDSRVRSLGARLLATGDGVLMETSIALSAALRHQADARVVLAEHSIGVAATPS